MKHLNYRPLIYILIILLLFLIGGGYGIYNFYSEKKVRKHIVLINSFGKSDIGYGQFQRYLEANLNESGILPEIEVFNLNCDDYNEQDEIEQMRKYFDTLEDKNIDLILIMYDPAAYSSLKTGHSILKKVPIILGNINFPNESALKAFANNQVYTFRDMPDFKKNIDFIKTLHQKENVRILVNADITFLGKKSYNLLKKVVDRSSLRFWGGKWQLFDGGLVSKVEEFNKAEKFGELPSNPFTVLDSFAVDLMPFRYMKGLSMLLVMSTASDSQKDCIYLLDKFDITTRPLSRLLNIPTFSCVRQGFNENTKVVGGYMATDEISAKSVANLANQIFKKQTKGITKIQDLEKEYIVDWKALSLYKNYSVDNIPKHARIINYPFTEKYKKELYISGILFVILFIFIATNLILTRRKAKKEREYAVNLKKTYDNLSLSITGGNVSLWNIQKGVLEFDDNFNRLTGASNKRYVFNHFLKNLHPNDFKRIQTIFEKTRELQRVVIERVRLSFDKGDSYRWYEIKCNSLQDGSADMVVAGIIQDIQDLVEREEALIRAKELAENAELKQSFLTNMSHEIRTPLNAIIGFTNILLGEEAQDFAEQEKAEMLDIVNHNTEVLLKLISDVLDISRLDSNNLEFNIQDYDVVKLVKDLYRTHQIIIHPPLQFNLVLDESIAIYIRTDKLRFTQVISNFLSNANKFTQEGHITLGCELNKNLHEVSIYVEDTGKGIDKDYQKMVFDRFYKTDEFAQGTGLGLSICKVIMEKLSGRIELVSEPGKGSRFIAVLPYIEA